MTIIDFAIRRDRELGEARARIAELQYAIRTLSRAVLDAMPLEQVCADVDGLPGFEFVCGACGARSRDEAEVQHVKGCVRVLAMVWL